MLCYKRQGNYVVYNELPSGTVGCRTRNGGFREFCSSNPEGSLFWFLSSKFLSFLEFRLSVRPRARSFGLFQNRNSWNKLNNYKFVLRLL